MKKVNFILILFFFLSCSQNKTPNGILPPQKMQDVLWDYIRADAFTSDFISKDSTKNLQVENVRLQKNLFSMHHISKEEFYNSYDYYLKHNIEMKMLLDSMIARKTREKLKFMKHLK